MYLPVDRETALILPSTHFESTNGVNFVSASKNFVAVCTNHELFVWLSHPQLLLCSAGNSVEHGKLQKLYWRLDTGSIAVTTSLNQILVYNLNVVDENRYNLIDVEDVNFQNRARELFLRGKRPRVHLVPSIVINLAAHPTCCVPSRDNILVFGENGFSHHLSWNGQIDAEMSFKLSSIPFATDQLQSKPEFVSSRAVHVIDSVYAPLVGGYSIVLSDGRAALLTSADAGFKPNSLLGVWALNLKDAVCCEANHKYRLLLFGCKNGDICAYNIDESNGSLYLIYRVSPKVNDGPDLSNRLGPVTSIRVLGETGGAFVVSWIPKAPCNTPNSTEATPSNSTTNVTMKTTPLPPIYAIFSPFGAQIHCNLEGLSEFESNHDENEYYTSIEWGTEGLHLWLGKSTGLAIQPMVRSASVGNPVMEHSGLAVMIGNNEVIMSTVREREKDASAPHSVWARHSISNEYISSNWPIKYATVSSDFSHLVVAGKNGFAYCSLPTSRWKIFGNESQEKDLMVTGGAFFYDGTVGVACVRQSDDTPQVRFYPLAEKLDNRYVSMWELAIRPILIANRGNVLAVFDSLSQILIYNLSSSCGEGRDDYIKVTGEYLAEIRLGDLIPHPACAVSLQLTQLSLDARQKTASLAPSVDTVLINIAGRLMTINCSTENEEGKGILNQPIVVASFVEQMWHDRALPTAHSKRETYGTSSGWATPIPVKLSPTISSPHLSNALWISCGAKGIKVWMPLIPGKRSGTTQEMTFIAKRIMLPFHLDIYPLVICARDCIALGVESLPQTIVKTSKGAIFTSSLHRNSEVFIHHLLRQLLKRNLGVFALEVAASCRTLPHFSHSLELLLHGVLEEEATSSEPIPDPLLPRCVAFIQEFPEFLRTVAHCARKTELALWPHLFAVTGSPIDLFEECIRQQKLDTAASYLIVLQNMESCESSIEQAARLLDHALAAGEWTIAREMLRFAHSIDVDDVEDSPRTTPLTAKTSLSRRPTVSSPGTLAEERNEFIFNRFQAGGKINKVRHSHQEQPSTSGRKDSASSNGNGGKLKHRVSRGQSGETTLAKNAMEEKMDLMVEKHVWSMLNQYSIRKLGFFITELSVDIIRLLEQRRKNISENFERSLGTDTSFIEDFPLAAMKLHADFDVAYPMVGSHVVHQLEKKLATLNTSVSAISLSRMTSLEAPAKGNALVAASPVQEVKNDDGESSGGDNEVIEEGALERVRSDTRVSDGNEGQRSSDGTEVASTRPHSPSSSSIADVKYLRDSFKDLVEPKRKKNNNILVEQLAYMLNVFASSKALDWIFVICLLQQDEQRLRQEICVENVKICGDRAFAHIRFACDELSKWAYENCPGYVGTLQAFAAHLDIVAEQSKIDLKKLKDEKVRKETTGAEKKIPPKVQPQAEPVVNGALGDAFEGRRSRVRGRSRSVDRGVQSRYEHVVSNHDAPQEDGCVIM